ncbi:MAG TPA: hypothetical protein VH540_01025 [Ktedonobacterales bacterium]|jgi:hypothetical protein
MTISHDPNHSSGAGLVLSESAEETAEATLAGKVPSAQASRSRTGFWAGMVMALLGAVALGAGLIYFFARPGLLSLEGMGSGLGVLLLCGLLVVGARRLIEAPAEQAPPRITTPLEPFDAPAPSEPLTSSVVPPPEAAPGAPADAAPAAPTSDTLPEPELEAAPAAPGKKSARKPGKSASGTSAQNGHTSAENVPTLTAGQAETSAPGEATMPSLANLPERYHLSATHAVIDEDVDNLGDLLGRVAEQGAMLMTAKGRQGAQRRATLAGKIEQFQHDLAHDPDYAPVADFFASMAALLRAGKLIPPAKPLVDPFDGLYQYVLTLVRRRM